MEQKVKNILSPKTLNKNSILYCCQAVCEDTYSGFINYFRDNLTKLPLSLLNQLLVAKSQAGL